MGRLHFRDATPLPGEDDPFQLAMSPQGGDLITRQQVLKVLRPASPQAMIRLFSLHSGAKDPQPGRFAPLEGAATLAGDGGEMKVSIKQFDVDMTVKNNGMELDVSDGKGHRGDLIITKSGLVWCEGKTLRANGTKMTWDEFIRLMEQR